MSKELTKVHIKDVEPHPKNPRLGNIDGIVDAINNVGFLDPITVQKSTGYVIAGSHRLAAAKKVGMKRIPAYIVDMSDEDALNHLLASNKLSDDSDYDMEALSDVLGGLDDLTGSGYADHEVDMVARRAAWAAEGDSTPAPVQPEEEDDAPAPTFAALTHRSMTFTFPADVFDAFAAGCREGRDRYSLRTPEELALYILAREGLIDGDLAPEPND